jgi:hypothetical protein
MLEIIARSLLIATRGVVPDNRETQPRQPRWEDAYFWQGRHGTPCDWRER